VTFLAKSNFLNFYFEKKNSVVVSNGVALPKNAVDDIIIAALESVRNVIRNGIPAAGIPSLDPFNLPHLQVDFDSDSARYSTLLLNYYSSNE
jgi:Haemolymph juvenile hormone binding protein (JHBP)